MITTSLEQMLDNEKQSRSAIRDRKENSRIVLRRAWSKSAVGVFICIDEVKATVTATVRDRNPLAVP